MKRIITLSLLLIAGAAQARELTPRVFVSLGALAGWVCGCVDLGDEQRSCRTE